MLTCPFKDGVVRSHVNADGHLLDDLPPFSELRNEETRERKAEVNRKAGVYYVVTTQQSFACLPEYSGIQRRDSAPSRCPTKQPISTGDPNVLFLPRFENQSSDRFSQQTQRPLEEFPETDTHSSTLSTYSQPSGVQLPLHPQVPQYLHSQPGLSLAYSSQRMDASHMDPLQPQQSGYTGPMPQYQSQTQPSRYVRPMPQHQPQPQFQLQYPATSYQYTQVTSPVSYAPRSYREFTGHGFSPEDVNVIQADQAHYLPLQTVPARQLSYESSSIRAAQPNRPYSQRHEVSHTTEEFVPASHTYMLPHQAIPPSQSSGRSTSSSGVQPSASHGFPDPPALEDMRYHRDSYQRRAPHG